MRYGKNATQKSKKAAFLRAVSYTHLITEGKLSPGARLPSIRRCERELSVSRTTAEAAYFQLAADGYVAVSYTHILQISSTGSPSNKFFSEKSISSSPFWLSGSNIFYTLLRINQMHIEMIIRHFNACVSKFGLYPLHKGKVSVPILRCSNPCPYNIFYAAVMAPKGPWW